MINETNYQSSLVIANGLGILNVLEHGARARSIEILSM